MQYVNKLLYEFLYLVANYQMDISIQICTSFSNTRLSNL